MIASGDVSQVVWLRKRFGRAQLATKVAGLQAAVVLSSLAYRATDRLPDLLQATLAVGVALGVVWASFRMARAFGRGSAAAARLLAVAVAPYGAYSLLVVARFVRRLGDGVDMGTVFSLALWVGTTYFMLRGLLAARSFRASRARAAAAWGEVASPWESGGTIERPSAFANKRSAAMYGFLFLIPCVWLVIALVSVSGELRRPSSPANADEEFGRQIFQLVASAPVWLLFAFLYRRARRAAVLRATDLRRRHHRPVVLYLRSFVDDQLKIRARATSGRTWLEAAPKVSFEEVVADHMFRYGPVVAIGRPSERGAPLGAARDYLPDDGWQSTVERLMGEAAAVVVVVGRTDGLTWEMNTLVQRGLTGKLILLLPPLDERDLRARWDFACDRLVEAHGIATKGTIDLRRTRAVLLRDGGLVAITAEDRDAWTYEVVLDTAAAAVTRQALPRAAAELPRLASPGLAGVATASSDRVGRAAKGLILAAGMSLGLGLAGVLGALPIEFGPPVLATSLSVVLLAAPAWMAMSRWLPAVGRRERALISAPALLQAPTALLFGADALRVLPLPLGVLFGAYFAYQYDRVDQTRRAAASARDAHQ